MPAGRMAAQEDPVGSAAVLGNVLVRPGERAGHVLDMFGMLHARTETVVRDDGSDPGASEATTDVGIHAQEVLVALHPGAAVNEKHHRKVLGTLGKVQVKLVLDGVRFVASVIGHVLDRLDLKRLGRLFGAATRW